MSLSSDQTLNNFKQLFTQQDRMAQMIHSEIERVNQLAKILDRLASKMNESMKEQDRVIAELSDKLDKVNEI